MIALSVSVAGAGRVKVAEVEVLAVTAKAPSGTLQTVMAVEEKKMASTAPTAAPADTPIMPGCFYRSTFELAQRVIANVAHER